jgi:uncharacterized protein
MIWETIITTQSIDGTIHIVPMGIRIEDQSVLLSPFRPSTTLDNLLATGYAVVNFTDDMRVFAGSLTGRCDWPTVRAKVVPGVRLEHTLSHMELKVERVEEDTLRPKIWCKSVHNETHAPFRGFNRAQAAIIEASILVSRLDMLPLEKIETEVQYLSIAIDKTAGPAEREAWEWLITAVRNHKNKGGRA